MRDGEQTRLLFRPEIVDNPSNPAACVRGTFLYQRKGKRDQWEDINTKSLSSFKKGDQYQIEIKAGELLSLLRQLGAMYRLQRSMGVPQGRLELVKVEQHLAKLLQFTEPELNEFLSANRLDAIETLRRVLRWLATHSPSDEHSDARHFWLPEVNALVGLANLRVVLQIWNDNEENPDEEFWQKVLEDHAFVLSQLFAYPIVVIKEKAYVGGKRVGNTHGNLVDFLYRATSSDAAILIEIKTPQTALLGPRYRQVFPPSREVSGALSQVLEYRESLMREVYALTHGETLHISTAEPRCPFRVVPAANSRTTFKSGHLSVFEIDSME